MGLLVSKVNGQPIAYMYRGADVRTRREGPDDPQQILQSSAKRLDAGLSFRQHAHLSTERHTFGTQEAWVVVSGRLWVTLTDVDDTELAECELGPGDCLVTFAGGHGMAVIEEALVYEFKNGPYMGQDADKRWVKDA